MPTRRHAGPLAFLTLSLISGLSGCFVPPAGGGGIGFSDPRQDDDAVYFAPGPEFKLSREAAAEKAYKSEVERPMP